MSKDYEPKRAAKPSSDESEKKQKNKKKGKMKKSKKITLIVLAIILGLLLILFAAAALFVNHKLNLINYEEPTQVDTNKEFVEEPDEKLDFAEMDDVTGTDFKSILKNWATNGGEKMKNKNIINVLLIGSDASTEMPGRATVTDKGNTDVMMIVSINKTAKKVKLISVMRDSYTYMTGFDTYAKLNAACANGGPEYLTETIENDYKIEIDGYAIVDFDSFRQVIDILGGVKVDVPKYVADYLNKGPDYNGKIPVPNGNGVMLNGEQALAFCRVRHTDANGDVSRVARQRQVINSLIDKCKNASMVDINSVIDVILANVRTNIGKADILKYATQAVTNGWANFEITEITMPSPDSAWGYNGSATRGNWVWIVDYPKAAQNLQNEIYGETNIHLEENRKTAISIMGGRPASQSKYW